MNDIVVSTDIDVVSSVIKNCGENQAERTSIGPYYIGVNCTNRSDLKNISIFDDSVIILIGNLRNIGNEPPELEKLKEDILSTPDTVLKQLNGSFSIVVATENRLLVASDIMGSRPLYYSTVEDVILSTSPTTIAPFISDPNIDEQGVTELLTYDVIQGQRTLLTEISAIPAASYISATDGTVDVERYYAWEADTGQKEYGEKILDRYRSVVKADMATVDSQSRVGMYLSGGLDSRLLAGVLRERTTDIRTFTYDANPGGGENLEPAKKVADSLGLQNNETPFTPGEFAKALEEGVKETGGRFSCRHMHNLQFRSQEIGKYVDVIFRTDGQGNLFGEDITPEALQNARSTGDAVKFYHQREKSTPVEVVDEVLNTDVDVTHGLYRMADQSPYTNPKNILKDLYYQSYLPNSHYRSNIAGSEISYRFPLVDKRLLELSAGMPSSERERNKFFISPLKLDLIRRFDSGLESIPYERTHTPPKYPMPVHAARMVIDRLSKFLSPKSVSQNQTTLYDTWYRENEKLRTVVDSYLEDAKQRDVFDQTTIERLRRNHLVRNGNHFSVLAAITTAEIFLQHVDKGRNSITNR